MSDPISSINAVVEAQGRESGGTAADDPPPGAPQRPDEPVATPVRAAPPSGVSAFAAQVIGQSNRRRGLKAGPPVLQEAKSAYLEIEFSGARERRARTGRVARTDV